MIKGVFLGGCVLSFWRVGETRACLNFVGSSQEKAWDCSYRREKITARGRRRWDLKHR